MVIRIVFIAFVACLPLVSAEAEGLIDAPVSFSAERTVTVDGKSYTGMMYHVPGAERHEQNMMGLDEVFILDDKNGSGDLILPGLKTYIPFPFPPLLGTLLDADLRKDRVGDEAVGGAAATKYRVEKDAPDGTHGEGYVWLNRQGVLMKMAGTVTMPGGHETKIAMSLANLKEAPQKPQLFTVPGGLSALPVEALAPLLGLKLPTRNK